jgi:hypothetical protein
VVVLVPSLTVIVPVGTIPKVRRDVPAVNGTLPVPVAGVGVEADDEPDVADELELPDDEEDDKDELELVSEPVEDELVLFEPPLMLASALCTAEVSWVLTRLSAVSLAMLARPADKVVEAPNMLLMIESVWATLALFDALWLQ